MDLNELKNKLIEKDFSSMNERQFEAVTTVNGPLLVLAGAGSGKTTVLVNRIAYLCRYGSAYTGENEIICDDFDIKAALDYLDGKADTLATDAFALDPPKPWQILAITFTNKAANELKNRISAKLGGITDVWAGTFHSICGRILRRNAEALGFSSHFTVYDTDDQRRLMKAVIKDAGLSDRLFTPKGVLSYVSAAKDQLIDPAEYAATAGSDYKQKAISALYAEYQKRLIAADAMDFDDMIFHTVRLFRENEDALKKYSTRFRYIMVDEYQDTNYAQYELVRLLSTAHGNICVVGDDDQSIYRFRGATIENILNFEKHFKNAKVIRLEQNYRSTARILDAANEVIKNNRSRKGKTLWTAAGEGEKINVYTALDADGEAKYVTESISAYVAGGGRFSDCAVLYRMNAQSAAFENVFARSGISYRIIGGFRFYERKEIKDVLAYLCVINNKNDAVRLRRVINEPKRGIGETTVSHAEDIAGTLGVSLFEVFENAAEYTALSRAAAKLSQFCEMIEELSAAADALPLPELFDTLLQKTGYREYINDSGEPDAKERLLNIDELKNNITAYCEEHENPTLSEFLEEIALVNDIDSMNESEDRVTLMTVHSAKGLEFENVYLVGMEEGIFPGNQSVYGLPEDIEEERRLAYVAITRAKRRLYISRATSRTVFGRTERNLPSRFLNEIPQDLCESSAAPPQRSAAFSFDISPSGGRTDFSDVFRKRPAPSAPAGVYKKGQTVEHSVFGRGMIISASPMGNDTLLEIAFDNAGTKKIMANYAKITVL